MDESDVIQPEEHDYQFNGVNQECDFEQWWNFYDAGVMFTEKQFEAARAFRECDKPDGPFEVGIGGARGGGKAQKLSSKVRNHRGWTTMGSLKVGSIIMNPCGVQQKVIQIYDRGKLQFYKVTFEDGSSTEVSADHLWGYKPMSKKPRRKNKASNIAASAMPDTNRPDQDWNARYDANCNVTTTEDLIERIARGQKIAVPLMAPIENQNPKRNKHTIEPYFMGVLLGDGCICHGGNTVSITTMDHEVDYVARWNLEQWGGKVNSSHNNNNASWIVGASVPHLKKALKNLGIDGKRAWEKSIPKEFLEGSLDSRWRLIQGLMDTDGYVDDRGHCSYTSTSEQLAKDFQELAWSLGFTAKITSKIPVCTNGKNGPTDCRRAYTVWLRGWHQDKLATISRKKDRLRKPQHYPMRRIVSIEATNVEDARCIKVSHPNGLYVTDDFIVTHNTFCCLSQAAIDDCQRFPGLKVLFLRKVGKSAKESLDDIRKAALYGVKHTYSAHAGMLRFEFEKGDPSVIIVGHYQTEGEIDSYLGIEYDLIIIEEATTLTETKYKDIKTCCRSSKPGWRPRLYLTTNPGGVGHMWFYKRFIVPMKRGIQTDTRFIPILSTDNPHLNPDYVTKVLGALTGWKKRAWLHGDWNILAGQYFSTLRDDIHISKHATTHDSGILRNYEFWCGFDYGFVHNTYCCLLGKDNEGNFYAFDEHCMNMTLVPTHAKHIKQMIARNALSMEQIETFEAGGDVFARDSKGEVIKDEYADNGIELNMANNSRVLGWQAILSILGDPEDIKMNPPKLFIHPKCVRLIECLFELTHNPRNPEDVLKVDANEDGEGGDDPGDGFRYGLMWKFSGDKVGVSKILL